MIVRHRLPALVAACLACTLSAQCAADEQSNSDPQANSKVFEFSESLESSASSGSDSVEANVVIEGFLIGPDGVKHSLNFGEGAKGLEAVPKELRKRIEKMIAEHETNKKGIKAAKGNGVRVIMVGPDGKSIMSPSIHGNFHSMEKMHKEMLKNLPEEARAALKKAMMEAKQKMADRKTEEAAKSGLPHVQTMGKMIVVGPNGKKQEFDFGVHGGPMKAFYSKKFEKEAHKKKLAADKPNELVLKKLEYLLKRIEKLELRIDELSKE